MQDSWVPNRCVTRHEDVYPCGENAYALANPHNFPIHVQGWPVLCADCPGLSINSSPSDMVSNQPIAQSHLTRLRVGPDFTPPFQLRLHQTLVTSQDGDFLRYKGLLYVPDNQRSDWTSFVPTMTMSGRTHGHHHDDQRTSVVSSMAPDGVFVTDYIHSMFSLQSQQVLHHKPFGPPRLCHESGNGESFDKVH